MEQTTPFDLNHAVSLWRNQLGASPSVSAVDLDEMESHLRDSASALADKGLSDEEAFWLAARRLGSTDSLACEFDKVHGRRLLLDRVFWMVCGWIAIGWLSTVTSISSVIVGAAWVTRGFGPAGQRPVSWLLAAFTVAVVVATSAIVWMLFRRWACGRSDVITRMRGRWVFAGCLLLGVVTWLFGAVVVRVGVYGVSPQNYGTVALYTGYIGLFVKLIGWPSVAAFLLTKMRRADCGSSLARVANE